MKLSSITLWDKNPRKISPENFEKLKQSLSTDIEGLAENKICLNKIGGELVVYCGNQRTKALIDLGHEELPDDYFEVSEIPEKLMISRAMTNNEGY